MPGKKREENNIKSYFQSNLPSLIFHFFLSIIAVMGIIITSQVKSVFFIILIMYVLFGLFLKSQGSLWKNVQSVSLIIIINLILFTAVRAAVPQLLMLYSLPYVYLGFINEQLINLAIILPSISMLIGQYVKILVTQMKK